MDRDDRISVIMPAHDAAAFLPWALPPLIALREAGEVLEVIVADDAATDGSAGIARALGAEVLSLPRNAGPAAARNAAAARARGGILWFVDSDVVVGRGGPARIRAALAQPAVGAVFGAYDAHPADPHWFSRYKNLAHRFYHLQAGRQAPGEAPGQVGGRAQTFWAGCGAVRADLFRTLGGFDAQAYPRPSIEDIELGYRIAAAGRAIAVDPGLEACHLKGWRMGPTIRNDIANRALPWSRLIASREGLGDTLNIGRAERARAVLAAALLLALLAALAGLGSPGASWGLAGLLALAALAANAALFRFLARTGGLGVALGGLAFHQVYYLYSAVSFAWCQIEARLAPAPAVASGRRR
ncbi:glycosyltransferase [Frigidibacter sp. MR17.14]|uniref:glycosyltransferase n=1 Tax=Frigidibacter sp. MR17.14 TaxID=3126509 RepID=UPI0030131227